MSFVPKTQPSSGKINAVTLGTGDKAIVIGGQNVLPFYTFDAAIEHAPKIGVEISDAANEWKEAGIRSFYEGCLSFDGYQAVRKRWLDITARWQDEDGNKHEEHLHGWPARIFQHETDHLSGELYIDQAEIRSLTTNENLEDFWCEDPVPTEAAAELGFEL